MEDSTINLKYEKYKRTVKQWENDFKRKNMRIPSKYDIHEAPQEIRAAYKMYYKLKTAFLENTLNEVLSEDGYDALENSQNLSFNDNNDNVAAPISTGLTALINNAMLHDSVNEQQFPNTWLAEQKISSPKRDFEAVENLPANLDAWDSTVSKQINQSNDVPNEAADNKTSKLKMNLCKNMLKSSSFNKRNPRKSLKAIDKSSKSVAATNAAVVATSQELLPDLETILIQKAKEQQAITSITANPLLLGKKEECKDTLCHTTLNKAWLQRTTSINKATLNNESKPTSLVPASYGLSNINLQLIIQTKTNNAKIEEVDSGSDAKVSGSENEEEHEHYRHIVKKRRLNIQQIQQTPAILQQNETNTEEKVIENSGNLNSTENITKTIKKAAKKSKIKNSKSNNNKKTASKKTRKREKNIDIILDEVEEEIPNVEQLKCTLRLENGNITSVPRIAPADIDAADDLINRYINEDKMARRAAQIPEKNGPDAKRSDAQKVLESKIAAGTLNENFVSINLQKKRFTRGKKPMNFSKYKKQLWKHKKHVAALTGPDMDMRGCDGGILTCYNCGRPGHFAQQCKQKGDQLLNLTALETAREVLEDSDFLTLDEAQKISSKHAVAVPSLAKTIALHKNVSTEQVSSTYEDDLMTTDDELENIDINAAIVEEASHIKDYVGHKIPADFLSKVGLNTATYEKHSGCVTPLYQLNANGSLPTVTTEVMDTLRMFGHTDFRKGQDRAVMRILCGLSTLVTLSTGSGKSLCYQLPAYLYSRQKGWITLVISPLVSLMEDQATGVPHFLRVFCLHTNQTEVQRMKIIEAISQAQVDVLLVSPEAVVAGERSTGFGAILRQLPPIAFACIDEAHCVSQWSHNFRPSYLMICKVLRQNLGISTILGLTATATMATRNSIIEHLGIRDGMAGIISDIPVPSNLYLSVSKDENRDAALLSLLRSERFATLPSIIVYCTRRDMCDRLAAFLRTALQDEEMSQLSANGNKKRKRKSVNWHAEPYHAGMIASKRRTIQNAFMRNELRLVVATIAFGMGINKPDIRAIIHYNMPRNFESYVQEVGRAGRDGKPSHCHLFLDPHGNDQFELRRHIYANSIDRHVIRKLLQRIFVPCSCAELRKTGEVTAVTLENGCPGHEIGFSQERTVDMLDIPAENISTLLCYLELDTRWRIQVLSSAYINCKVISYGGAKYLKEASKKCPPLAMAIALEMKRDKFKPNDNIIEFSVIEIAASIGWNSGVVKHQLKNLEWTEVNGRPKRSTISVMFHDLGFRLRAPGDFTDTEVDDALNTLFTRSVQQEHSQLIQLQYTFQGLSSVAYERHIPCMQTEIVEDRSEQLKCIIRSYFRDDHPKNLKLHIETCNISDEQVQNDVNAIVNLYPDNNFSGRNIARIFHGISSPNYPAVMWGRCKYWRAHTKTDFNRILKLANEVIVGRRL